MKRVSAPSAPPFDRLPSAGSKYSSNLARSWPPSSSPNSLNYVLKVHLQTRYITPSKCISKLARLPPPSTSLSSLNLSLPVYIQTRTISASKWLIAEFTLSSSSGAPRIALNHRLQPVLIYRMEIDTWIHRSEYELNTWVLKIFEW